MDKAEFASWLDGSLPAFENLRTVLVPLVENILVKEGIEFLDVSGRSKDKRSALSKLDRKKYRNASVQMTDVCGIRVITFLTSQVEEIEKVLRSAFNIDNINSSNRDHILEQDRVGYRSIHLVATLGPSRAKLPEYGNIHGLNFEVQIRTVLQHAWAELAHDRSFKFGIALPSSIQRKLNLYAGMLEIVDSAFVDIAKEIDSYKDEVRDQSFEQLLNEEIDEISISRYIGYIAKKDDIAIEEIPIGGEVIQELRNFRLVYIKDIDKLRVKELVASQKQSYSGRNRTTTVGILRDIMLYNDVDRYFKYCWNKHWSGLDEDTKEMLLSKYDYEKISSIVARYNLHAYEPYTYEHYDNIEPDLNDVDET